MVQFGHVDNEDVLIQLHVLLPEIRAIVKLGGCLRQENAVLYALLQVL